MDATTKSPNLSATDEPQAPATADVPSGSLEQVPEQPAEEPNFDVDPELRRWLEGDHERRQREDWNFLFGHGEERQRAAMFAHLATKLWDDLSVADRERVLRSAEAEAEWPGTFDRMREDNERAHREFVEAERAAEESLAAGRDQLLRESQKVLGLYEGGQGEGGARARRASGT